MAEKRMISFKREIERKSVHLLGGLQISMFGFFVPEEFHAFFMYGFACFIVFLCLLEWLRLHDALKLPMLRDYERRRVGGYFFFFLGAFICFLIFPREIATASVLMLSTGDAVSGIILAAKHPDTPRRPSVKPFPVASAMFLTSFASCYIFFCAINHPSSLIKALSGATGATIADTFPLRTPLFYVDDNLSIPLLAGCAMILSDIMSSILLYEAA